jgi:hypothetical protein
MDATIIIKQIESNQKRLIQLERERTIALIQSIAWQIAKDSGYSSPRDPRAMEAARRILEEN